MAEVILKDIVKIYPYIDKKQKKGIFKKKSPKVDQEQLAATATLLAARDKRTEVTEQDIENARAQMVAGVDTKKKVNLQITEKGVVAVQQFNLTIKDNEFIVLVGPSGCGKSTTLRMVAGLEDITEGELYIDGRLCNAIEPKDRDIAMVFQSYALYPHMTVMQNMEYPLRILAQNITYDFEIEYLENANQNIEVKKTEMKLELKKKEALMKKKVEEKKQDAKAKEEQLKALEEKFKTMESALEAKFVPLDEKKKENSARIEECKAKKAAGEFSYVAKMSRGMRQFKVMKTAEMLNITEYLQRKPRNLSGGQRQRVAIGRACVRNPKVLLMDEPLSNLDAKLRNEMRAEIIKLRSKINTTFLYVTHDQTEAMTLGDRIVVMKDGFIQQIGTPQDVFDHPANLFVSGFIGTPKMNYFVADLKKENGKYSVTYGDYTVVLSDEKQANLTAKAVEPQEIIIGVRPDHMVIGDKGIAGKVEVSELMGTSFHLHLNIDGQDAIAIVPNKGNNNNFVGQEIKIGFDPNVIHMFSKEDEHNLEF